MDQYPHEFSGGMRQRVMIAMALCCQPRLLIADEPTTALDVTIQAQILQLLKQLNENEQMNIILITHDLGGSSFSGKTDRSDVRGLIMEEGTTEEIFEHPTHPYTESTASCDSKMWRVGVGNASNRSLRYGTSSLANPPAGCPFVTRCRFACEECKKGIPSMRAYSDTQSSRCIFTKRRTGRERGRKKRRNNMETKEQYLLKRRICPSISPVKNFFGKLVQEVRAVSRVNLSIKKGETFGLVGESGCPESPHWDVL